MTIAKTERIAAGTPCIDCAAPLSGKGRTGRCRSCAGRANHADPAFRARLVAACRAVQATPEHRAKMKATAARTQEERRSDPAWAAYKRASGLRLRAQYDGSPKAQAANLAKRKLVGRKVSEKALGWCPKSYRAEYRKLRDANNIAAPDARRMIEEQIARDEADRIAAMTPTERQVEKVRAGARVVERIAMPSRVHAFTLGGVAPEAL